MTRHEHELLPATYASTEGPCSVPKTNFSMKFSLGGDEASSPSRTINPYKITPTSAAAFLSVARPWASALEWPSAAALVWRDGPHPMLYVYSSNAGSKDGRGERGCDWQRSSDFFTFENSLKCSLKWRGRSGELSREGFKILDNASSVYKTKQPSSV